MVISTVFEGIRVADFAWVGVGPLVSKYLADHGAEVIRIESSVRPEPLRRAPPFANDEPGLDNSGYYADFNSSKQCVSLNLQHPDGVAIAKRIVEHCDIVTESFTPKAMRAWGMTYEDLCEVRPDLIMISMPMYGLTGPWSMWQGYGHVLQAAAGISHLTAYPGEEPIGTGVAYTDFLVPHFAASALLAALDHRRRTGEGQNIDFGQMEAAIHATETMVLDYTVNGREQQPLGAGHPDYRPYGTYQCAARGDDDDRWIAITVTSEAELAALADVAGQPSWTSLQADALDSELASWTRTQQAEVLMQRLQSAGVPAGVVQTPEDLRNDPQLAHRGHFWMLDHPTMGHRAYDGPSFRLSETPAELTKAAPLLGEDNEYVYKDIVGMSEEEYVEHLVSGAFD
ncbi:MAG: CoA transferase [Chloroflexi bacterium]|nr:CoA transferase [Chloroflexota bacterium]MCY3587302.1 CoA transferase [Chloroflexota bacterium]MCY3686662.1 CoA transferase [Chloroflexota bacterium]MDE2709147.1 CoA transferase [Chloroflexota bacterium]